MLMYEKHGDEYELFYRYDNDGRPQMVMLHNSNETGFANYSVVTNSQGDIVKLLNGAVAFACCDKNAYVNRSSFDQNYNFKYILEYKMIKGNYKTYNALTRNCATFVLDALKAVMPNRVKKAQKLWGLAKVSPYAVFKICCNL